jgi:DNA-directed RNA polymerase sigma subunit (sigma70/sigma32)
VSAERIRQLEANAMKKLKASLHTTLPLPASA